jgi:hypothetical protein
MDAFADQAASSTLCGHLVARCWSMLCGHHDVYHNPRFEHHVQKIEIKLWTSSWVEHSFSSDPNWGRVWFLIMYRQDLYRFQSSNPRTYFAPYRPKLARSCMAGATLPSTEGSPSWILGAFTSSSSHSSLGPSAGETVLHKLIRKFTDLLVASLGFMCSNACATAK